MVLKYLQSVGEENKRIYRMTIDCSVVPLLMYRVFSEGGKLNVFTTSAGNHPDVT